MESEVVAERVRELLKNGPGDNIERLPEDIQEAFDAEVAKAAESFAFIASSGIPLEMVLSGAIGQAFFAGHEYAVRYGNLNAEMEVTDETLPNTDS